jgi:hypothetical protein
MKQAVLITAYKDFNYLIDFAKYLSEHELLVFIHVDKKNVNSSVLQQLNAIPNVVAISEYKVPWGGYQHVQAFLALIRLALQCDQRMYIHLVTGQDCLCRPIKELNDFFCEANNHNYMSCAELSDSFRCRTYYRNDWFNYKSTCGNFITKASHIIQKVVGVKRHCPNHYNVYKGMVYVSITSDFASYILSFLNTREGKQYFNWLKWCFIPE